VGHGKYSNDRAIDVMWVVVVAEVIIASLVWLHVLA
jgi:hypothetical protein